MFEFGLPFCVRRKCVAGLRFALRLDREHFARVIENGGRGFDFCAGPFAIAERAERRRFFSCADVARNQISLLERHIELRFIGELECEYFLLFVLVGTRVRRPSVDAGRARRSRPTAIFVNPRNRPMPCSRWTTRSPSASSLKSIWAR